MIESKKPVKKKDDNSDDYDLDFKTRTILPFKSTGDPELDKRIQ